MKNKTYTNGLRRFGNIDEDIIQSPQTKPHPQDGVLLPSLTECQSKGNKTADNPKKQEGESTGLANPLNETSILFQGNEEERLLKKIAEILAGYKFNSTQTQTCEMVTERIIEIVRKQALTSEIIWLEELCRHSEGAGLKIKQRIAELKGALE